MAAAIRAPASAGIDEDLLKLSLTLQFRVWVHRSAISWINLTPPSID
jgi:hypothetical protein